jgi:hypothetical protein
LLLVLKVTNKIQCYLKLKNHFLFVLFYNKHNYWMVPKNGKHWHATTHVLHDYFISHLLLTRHCSLHLFWRGKQIMWQSKWNSVYRAPDKLRICVFYAMKTSKNACIIRSECTHYAYILLCKQTFKIRNVLVQSCT